MAKFRLVTLYILTAQNLSGEKWFGSAKNARIYARENDLIAVSIEPRGVPINRDGLASFINEFVCQ